MHLFMKNLVIKIYFFKHQNFCFFYSWRYFFATLWLFLISFKLSSKASNSYSSSSACLSSISWFFDCCFLNWLNNELINQNFLIKVQLIIACGEIIEITESIFCDKSNNLVIAALISSSFFMPLWIVLLF